MSLAYFYHAVCGVCLRVNMHYCGGSITVNAPRACSSRWHWWIRYTGYTSKWSKRSVEFHRSINDNSIQFMAIDGYRNYGYSLKYPCCWQRRFGRSRRSTSRRVDPVGKRPESMQDTGFFPLTKGTAIWQKADWRWYDHVWSMENKGESILENPQTSPGKLSLRRCKESTQSTVMHCDSVFVCFWKLFPGGDGFCRRTWRLRRQRLVHGTVAILMSRLGLRVLNLCRNNLAGPCCRGGARGGGHQSGRSIAHVILVSPIVLEHSRCHCAQNQGQFVWLLNDLSSSSSQEVQWQIGFINLVS